MNQKSGKVLCMTPHAIASRKYDQARGPGRKRRSYLRLSYPIFVERFDQFCRDQNARVRGEVDPSHDVDRKLILREFALEVRR